MLPTTTQNTVALETQNALQEFLADDVITIVNGYLTHTDALEPVIMGADGWPVESELNIRTIDAIKLALSSSTCDRDVIRQIFLNAHENGYKAYLNDLFDELRCENQPIILDNVNFARLNLSGLNLENASCIKANFEACIFDDTSFIAADLTDSVGLMYAFGVMTVNCQTIFTGSGLLFDADKMQATFGTDGFGYVLADAPDDLSRVLLDMGGWKITVKSIGTGD